MLAQASAGALDGLVQFGAVGILAALALAAVRVLFARLTSALEREIARADRLERELLESNRQVQDRYLTTVSEATRVMATVVDAMRRDSGVSLRKDDDR